MGLWEPLEALDPTECGGFQLTHRVGEGGFGDVFLGYRSDIQVPAAVKIIKSDHLADRVKRNRFKQEIELLGKMSGMHTAALLDADGDAVPPWLATQYIHAPSLYALICRYGPLDELGAWWLVTSLAEALIEIHTKQILHRDLKPQNVLVARTGLHVIDFGISRYVQSNGMTADSKFFGSREFAPKEQLNDPRTVTERSDVFALACVAVYAITGRPPFHYASLQDRFTDAPPDLTDVPTGIYALLEACLSAAESERPVASAVYAAALDRLLGYGVPVVSETGLPLLAEIRDFVDDWCAQPIPASPFTLVPVGVASATSGLGSDAGGGAPAGSGTAPTKAPGPEWSGFGADWVGRWNSTAKKQRESFGL